MSPAKSMSAPFQRDLIRLCQQIEAFADEAALWKQTSGITNPAGNLILHIEGNLREYVGRQLGNMPYVRDRTREFAVEGVPRHELIARVEFLRDTIPAIIEGLTEEQLAREFPEVVLQRPISTEQFLIHLYGHLNWHLGQVDIIRRIQTGQGALTLAGL